MNIGGPYVVVDNRTGTTTYLKQSFEHAMPGDYGSVIEIPPGKRKEIPANVFEKRSHYSLRSSFIDLFVGQLKARGRFTPDFFTGYVKIIFEQSLEDAATPCILIKGVKGQSLDLLKRLVKIKMLGDKYEGRPETTLSSWRLFPVEA